MSGYVTPHRPKCPAIGDEDITCHCWRAYIADLPTVDPFRVACDFGGAALSGLVEAGRIRLHPLFGFALTPENLP